MKIDFVNNSLSFYRTIAIFYILMLYQDVNPFQIFKSLKKPTHVITEEDKLSIVKRWIQVITRNNSIGG